MQSLLELQRAFCTALLFDDRAALTSLAVIAGKLEPVERLAVYRNNVLGNYRKALSATYPVVKRLVGAPFFDAAVDHFVRGYPSRRGDVNRYGGEFAIFLEAYRPARDLVYLADVARLEWAIDQAGIAADAPAFDLQALSAVPPDAQASLRFTLHPSARIVASAYPILHLWKVNQPDYRGDDRVDLGDGDDTLLVVRGGTDVSIERISRGERAFLAALASHATLADAADCAAEVETGFDLAVALRHHIASRAIVAFRAPASGLPGSGT